jgi:hypothetical protein
MPDVWLDPAEVEPIPEPERFEAVVVMARSDATRAEVDIETAHGVPYRVLINVDAYQALRDRAGLAASTAPARSHCRGESDGNEPDGGPRAGSAAAGASASRAESEPGPRFAHSRRIPGCDPRPARRHPNQRRRQEASGTDPWPCEEG